MTTAGPACADAAHPTAGEDVRRAAPDMLSGFRRQVRVRGGAEALRIGDRSYSYAQLDAKAKDWARRILETTGDTPRRVGVLAYRDEVSYIGPLAALFAGACFVPINPNHPFERIVETVGAARLDALLVSATAEPVVAALEARGILLNVLAPLAGGRSAVLKVTGAGRGRHGGDAEESSLAYLLFTSGSTGRPKGVPISHESVCAFLDAIRSRYDFGPDDRFSQTFDQTFDLSIFDLFVAWDCGASVYSLSSLDLLAPLKFIDRHRITVWFSVPSLAMLQIHRGHLAERAAPSLRWSLFCGEALPQSVAEAWSRAAPRSVVENLYGPTECTIACFAYRWDPIDSPAACVNGIVPIGVPFPMVAHVLIDEDGKVSEDEGELCLSGPQCFAGYWSNASSLNDPFVETAPVGRSSSRFYRTGDRVRRVGDDYAFLGRTDHQVKILGQRVELGEIEYRLRECGCDQAVVLARRSLLSTDHLVAFVTGEARADDLRKRLQDYLPPTWVPRLIRVLAAMPVNVNGKVDRPALEAMCDALQFAGGMGQRSC